MQTSTLLSTTKNTINQSKDIQKLQGIQKQQLHGLLPVADHRRVSVNSSASVVSCPTMVNQEHNINQEHNTTPSLSLRPSPTSDRRQSVQAGAPAIGFSGRRLYTRRGSQPSFKLDSFANIEQCARYGQGMMMRSRKNHSDDQYLSAGLTEAGDTLVRSKYLSKRVSWLSMKNYQGSSETLTSKRARRQSVLFDDSRSNSRANSQIGSVLQLDNSSLLDRETDTPPLDTVSWSCTDGNRLLSND